MALQQVEQVVLVRDARQLGEGVQRQRAQRAEHLARVRVRVRVGLGLGLGLGFRVLLAASYCCASSCLPT